MKRLAILVTLCASPIWASAPAERDAAAALVRAELVEPLAAKESRRSRFSRARPAPTARRVRILDQAPLKDQTGAAFVRFAIDIRSGFLEDDEQDGWQKDTESGCVYLASRQVFVRRADRHYPAALLLGQKTPPADAHVCQPQPPA